MYSFATSHQASDYTFIWLILVCIISIRNWFLLLLNLEQKHTYFSKIDKTKGNNKNDSTKFKSNVECLITNVENCVLTFYKQ